MLTHIPLFIILEGVDGSGKSTQARLLIERLKADGLTPGHYREPGSTGFSETVRGLLLEGKVPAHSEAFLFMAARADTRRKIFEECLSEMRWAVCERGILSTLAYQRDAFEDRELLRKAVVLSEVGFSPDLTIVLDIDPSEAIGRIEKSGKVKDAFESRGFGFLQRVREAYTEESMILERSGARVTRLYATKLDQNEVHRLVMDAVHQTVAEICAGILRRPIRAIPYWGVLETVGGYFPGQASMEIHPSHIKHVRILPKTLMFFDEGDQGLKPESWCEVILVNGDTLKVLRTPEFVRSVNLLDRARAERRLVERPG
jgi:dTMP kinase